MIDHIKPDSMYTGSSAERLAQQKLGTAKRARTFYQKQWVDQLNEDMQAFIQRQEMVFIATADEHGNPDCSLRAGAAGFIQVLDSTRLAYPEYRGNGVMASVGNILSNPQIGMMFVDFFQSTVGLHVNGKAHVLENHELAQWPNISQTMLEEMKVEGGRQSVCWVLVEIEEAYIHCGKHIPLLAKLDKPLHWGTDEESSKGGDFFHIQLQ
jgi:predicted pyridoxine 5'-phosphate oxidase superfamily flavin-nucleotide-binding protein